MGRANQGKSKPYGGNPPPNAALTLKGFSAPWQTIRHLLRAASADRPIVGTNKRTLANPSNPLMIFCTRIRETDQIFAHVENKSADMESAMTFKQGVSGNPHGNRHRTRHLLNQEFMQALLLHFRQHGKKAIEKVAREQPASYLKILGLLVPREHKVEHSNSLKNWTDEELEAGIDLVKQMLESRAAASGAVIEGTAEPVGMLGPAELEQPQHKRSNRLLEHVDTAVAPKERKPRKPVDA